jgi:HAD superfamily phosphoserine phosphatase-like hydrolase
MHWFPHCNTVFTPNKDSENMQDKTPHSKRYLLASDFDQTLSFNDSGFVLSELLGASNFEEKIAGLSRTHFVQQGAELSHLLLHDPEYRRVRREHLHEVGKRVRLKQNIPALMKLVQDLEGCHFSFYVISAAPEEVIQSALEGIVPPDHIVGTRFQYAAETGEIQSILRVPAGYGKVAALEELRARLGVPHDRIAYVGDGSSDVHVMLHLNRCGGLTIAVSENKYITEIARRTVLADDALGVAIPILEELMDWAPSRIRNAFEAHGHVLHEWDKVRTDTVKFRPVPVASQVTN